MYVLPNGEKISQEEVAKKIKRLGAEEVSLVTGGTDIIVKFRVKDVDELNDFVQHLAALTGNLLSIENPFLSASFDGFEIQATLGVEFVPAKFAIVRK